MARRSAHPQPTTRPAGPTPLTSAGVSSERWAGTPPCPGYAPIGSYGFLADGRTAALAGADVRGPPQHFTHSKVMSWVALDRGIRLAEELGHDADALRWAPIRDELRAEVLDRGYDERRGAFVQAYGSKALDASALRFSHVGFVAGNDPRMDSTIDRIREELEVDGLVYRYRVEETDDGLRGREGAFGICSFWLVSSLALAGRSNEAEDVFGRLLGHANELGLYAEEVAPGGQLLGNFPQAFTHLSLIQAAANCDAAREGAQRLRAWATRERWL